MSEGRVIMDLLSYSDDDPTNDPFQTEIKWKQQWNVDLFAYSTTLSQTLTAGAVTEINLPAALLNWVFIVSDQTIDIVTTARVGGWTAVPAIPLPAAPSPWTVTTALGEWSVPMTTDGSVKDSLYAKRGNLTGLRIGVPGTTNAQVKIFLAY